MRGNNIFIFHQLELCQLVKSKLYTCHHLTATTISKIKTAQVSHFMSLYPQFS